MSGQDTPKKFNLEMKDQDLAKVSGGLVDPNSGHNIERVFSGWVTQVGMVDNWYGTLWYCPCPRCGKPMHSEIWAPKWYCDPCDFSEFNPRQELWSGTEAELIAAAE